MPSKNETMSALGEITVYQPTPQVGHTTPTTWSEEENAEPFKPTKTTPRTPVKQTEAKPEPPTAPIAQERREFLGLVV